MVLATETMAPTAIPWAVPQPINHPAPTPSPERQQYAQRPAENRHPLHLQKLAERKFQADRVHQEDDPDLGQNFELVNLRKGRTRSKGTNQKSAEDISQDQRLAQGFGHAAAHNGGAEHIGEVPEEGGFHCHRRQARNPSV